MAKKVKTRRYDSPRRREQAAATRRAILEAAAWLFERQGYAATTMAQIAERAGVSLKTVYLAFETKSGVLRALWHLRLRGEGQEEVPVAQQPWYIETVEEPDPERQLRLNARNSSSRQGAGGPAVRGDPERRRGGRRQRGPVGAGPDRLPREPGRDLPVARRRRRP